MKQIIFAVIFVFAFCFAAFAQTKENSCPKVKVYARDDFSSDVSAAFSVEQSEEIKKYNLEYVWTTLKGKIIRGQRTSTIELSVPEEEDASVTDVTVSVKVTGLPKDCADTFSSTIYLSKGIFDAVIFRGTDAREEKAYIDSLFYPIKDDKSSEGFISLHFEKNTSADKRIKRLRRIIKSIKSREYDVMQLTLRISKEDSEDDSDYAKFTYARTDSRAFKELSEDKDYIIIKAEELERKIKKIFPKK
jgi:ABC-type thiamine transport system substrate-binding protein